MSHLTIIHILAPNLGNLSHNPLERGITPAPTPFLLFVLGTLARIVQLCLKNLCAKFHVGIRKKSIFQLSPQTRGNNPLPTLIFEIPRHKG